MFVAKSYMQSSKKKMRWQAWSAVQPGGAEAQTKQSDSNKLNCQQLPFKLRFKVDLPETVGGKLFGMDYKNKNKNKKYLSRRKCKQK